MLWQLSYNLILSAAEALQNRYRAAAAAGVRGAAAATPNNSHTHIKAATRSIKNTASKRI
jgi:hypothetical protein